MFPCESPCVLVEPCVGVLSHKLVLLKLEFGLARGTSHPLRGSPNVRHFHRTTKGRGREAPSQGGAVLLMLSRIWRLVSVLPSFCEVIMEFSTNQSRRLSLTPKANVPVKDSASFALIRLMRILIWH